jgi:hypothetical protein
MAEPTNLPAVVQSTELGFLTSAIATFEGVQRLAEVMSKCGTLPDHLKGKPSDCFRIVVQAGKWAMDPFVVAECTSLVHGRLCYEGKLVAAALLNRGIGRLDYEITGKGPASSIVVTGIPKGGRATKSVSGSVADWRTRTVKDGRELPNNWDKDPHSMLVYRGTRQWARLWAPEVMAGVYTPDELEDVREVEGTVVATEPTPARTGEAPAESPPAPVPGTKEEPARNETGTPAATPSPAQPHPAIAAARDLYGSANRMLKGTGAKVMARACALHGADKPQDIAAGQLDAFAKTIAVLAKAANYDLLMETMARLEVDAQEAAREAAAGATK